MDHIKEHSAGHPRPVPERERDTSTTIPSTSARTLMRSSRCSVGRRRRNTSFPVVAGPSCWT
eukprot:2753815-Prorocentrum_lima.AAC.1